MPTSGSGPTPSSFKKASDVLYLLRRVGIIPSYPHSWQDIGDAKELPPAEHDETTHRLRRKMRFVWDKNLAEVNITLEYKTYSPKEKLERSDIAAADNDCTWTVAKLTIARCLLREHYSSAEGPYEKAMISLRNKASVKFLLGIARYIANEDRYYSYI